MRKFGFLAALVLLGPATTACSSSTAPAQSTANATDASPGDSGYTGCAGGQLAEMYAPDMVQHGAMGNLSFELVQVMVPNSQGVMTAGPPSEGTDQWTLKVLDKSGAPVTDATFPVPTVVPTGCPAVPAMWSVGVYACMPLHGHGTSQPSLMPNGDGTYTIDGLYFFMPGLWQIEINAKSGAVTDVGTFSFCIDG